MHWISDCSELEWVLVSLIFLYHWCFCIQTRSFDLLLLLTRPSANKVGIHYVSILTITVNDCFSDQIRWWTLLGGGGGGKMKHLVHHPETKDATNRDLNPHHFIHFCTLFSHFVCNCSVLSTDDVSIVRSPSPPVPPPPPVPARARPKRVSKGIRNALK